MPSSDDNALHEPEWVAHAIWWHLYPLGFVGADTERSDPSADPALPAPFDRITQWLDYARELGVSGILLGPIFASETHGYDTVDYRRIDPRLGDQAAFERFIAAAKERGLRVLLDGVFNHVGRGSELVRAAIAGGAGSAEARWFRIVGTADDGTPVLANFEGHDALVAFDHDEPAVADLVVEVMEHWLGLGIDGWRLDAAYSVPESFWAAVLPRVRQSHPDAYFVGEVIHGDYSGIVRTSTLDSITQYETWKAIWNGIDEGNLFELEHALGRHDGYLATFAPMTFVGNHDVTRLASAIDDPRHLAHALVVLFTIGGTPSIYYGDEQAFRGMKEERFGGDDAIRPEFPASGRDAFPAGGWGTYHLHQELIGVRRRHPWLHRATTQTLELTNTAFVYAASVDGELLVVGLNIGDEDASTRVDGVTRVIAGAATLADGTLTVPAHGWVITGT